MTRGWLRGLQRLIPRRPKPGQEAARTEGQPGFYGPPRAELGYRSPPVERQRSAAGATSANSVERSLQERLSGRLSSLAGLSEDQRAGLEAWCRARWDEVASAAGRQPETETALLLDRTAGQLFGFLNALDQALADWDELPPDLALGRLELLDTYLEPPLLDGQRRDLTRGRFEMLVEDLRDQPAKRPATSEIARRLLETLD